MFIKFYLILLFFSLFFWLVGWSTKRAIGVKEEISYYSILFNILIGVIAFATSVAIFYTKGKTVMIFSVLFGVLAYISYKRSLPLSSSDTSSSSQKYVILNSVLGLTAIFVFIYKLLFFEDIVLFSTSDYNFYAYLSYSIRVTGIEHCYANMVLPPKGIQPYHYLEIWLNAGVSSITKENELSMLFVVTYPTLIFLFYLGVCDLLKYMKFDEKYIFIVAFLTTFISGFSIPQLPIYQGLYEKFHLKLFSRTLWSYSYYKLSVIYAFTIAVIVLFARKKIDIAYLILLFLPVYYSSALIGVVGGILLVMLYEYLVKKSISKTFVLHFTLINSVLFIFYAVFQDREVGITPVLNLDSNWRTKINIIGSTGISFLILYGPTLIVLYLFLRKFLSSFFSQVHAWLLVTVPISALGGWVIFYKNLDSVQIFHNVALPVMNTSCIIVAVALLKYVRYTLSIFIFSVIVGVSIYQHYVNYFYSFFDKQEKDKEIYKARLIQAKLKNKPTHLGVFFREEYEYRNSIFYINTYAGSISFEFNAALLDTYAVFLNVHSINPEIYTENHLKEIAKRLVKISIFNRYVEQQKQKGTFVSIEQSQLDFIREFKVSFIATRPGFELPPHIKPLVKDKEKIELPNVVLYLL
ncbi:MAG: hypothetical protein NZ519_04270 [Bacteroidia bacterium]|nr:hypothetical protein [Bacteroidia bacterium]